MDLEEISARIQALPQGPARSALEEKLRAAKAKASSVANPAPAQTAGSPLGGGPGGASGGGGGDAPGADPYEVAHNAREAERAASEPNYVPKPVKPPLERYADMGRAVLHGLDKPLTLGLGTRLGEFVDPGTKARMEAAAAEYPALDLGGLAVGALSGRGLGGAIGKGASSIAGMAPGQGLYEVLARSMGAGALGGGVQAGAEKLISGADAKEADDAALLGAKWGTVLGPLGGLVSWAGQKMTSRLRDPATPVGRDLALVEEGGGSTDTLRGVNPGKDVQGVIDDVHATPGKAPEALAADRGVPVLGAEAEKQARRAVAGAGMQNEAMYSKVDEAGNPLTVSSRPLLLKSIKALKDQTDRGRLLPGSDVKDLAKQARAAASDIRIVKRTSDEAQAADPELMEDVGLMRHLGVIRGAPQSSDAESVVVFAPRDMTAKGVDATQRLFDRRGNAPAGVYDPAREPFKQLGNAAREARAEFGPEWEATKAAQSTALQRKGNILEASGLPRESAGVDLGDLGTREGLHGAIRAYRTVPNSEADKLLDQMAAQNPALRRALDIAAATAATQRLRGSADIQFSPKGGVSPYGFWGAARLHTDPLMRYFGTNGMAPVPAASSAAADQEKKQ